MSPMFAVVWNDLVRSTIKFPSKYIEYGKEFYQTLLRKQPDKNILEKDIYCLLGCYVWFGREIFINILFQGVRSEEEETLLLIMSHYQIECPVYSLPTQYSLITITVVASYFPFYVAEHLHSGRGSVIGKLNSLPRCLAFQSASGIIPRSSEWNTLFIRWKIWKTLLCATSQNYLFSHRYVFPAPKTDLSHEGKLQFMKLLNISPPELYDVLQEVREILIRYGYNETGNGFLPSKFSPGKAEILTSNLEELKEFYEQNITFIKFNSQCPVM